MIVLQNRFCNGPYTRQLEPALSTQLFNLRLSPDTLTSMRIASSHKPHSSERTTLLTVAKYLGVSRTTVSVVLSGAPAAASIPQSTRQRILDAAVELGYRPHFIASSLRSKRTMSIGIMVPDIGEGYFTLIMSGVDLSLRRARYFYFTACHHWQAELLAEHPHQLEERGIDGLLLINTPVPPGMNLPMVTISGHEATDNVTHIVIDHAEAARLALEHLQKLGHKRIALMKGQTFTLDAEERWDAILTIARDYGFEMDEGLLIPLVVGSWSPELGYGPVRDLLARRRDFTAIFCFNDIAAIGAIRALFDVGLRTPEDVSVIGFDDIVGATYHIPSLTTVRQPLVDMGAQATSILLEKIKHPERTFPDKVVLAPKLIVRESTKIAHASDLCAERNYREKLKLFPEPTSLQNRA